GQPSNNNVRKPTDLPTGEKFVATECGPCALLSPDLSSSDVSTDNDKEELEINFAEEPANRAEEGLITPPMSDDEELVNNIAEEPANRAEENLSTRPTSDDGEEVPPVPDEKH
ncbi:hypothetical protein H4R33_006622, partial [Dimargaris cristalligena]